VRVRTYEKRVTGMQPLEQECTPEPASYILLLHTVLCKSGVRQQQLPTATRPRCYWDV
jgi:hypothetical protein